MENNELQKLKKDFEEYVKLVAGIVETYEKMIALLKTQIEQEKKYRQKHRKEYRHDK